MEEKSNRQKYRRGGKILSMDELVRQDFVYFHDKIYHQGWFLSWQLRWAVTRLKWGELYYAIREDDEDEKSRRH